ncbi:MAG: aminoacyl-tRNA hydrolase [Betaproteobacteria bacterium]|jgi:PTH1 family peptidyl-tRNA hydrolase
MIKLIIGLGNPGKEHQKDRHNAGFWLCELFASAFNAKFSHESKLKGSVAKIKLGQADICFLLPTTFMNLSGESVSSLMRFHKILADEILVIHDELDLSPGITRLKWSGGSGGHNGLKSISSHLGTNDYWRLRIGIGHPRDIVEKGMPHQEVANFVLKRASQSEEKLILDSFNKPCALLNDLIQLGPQAIMKDLHTLPK